MSKFLRNIVLLLPAILIIAGGTKTAYADDFTAKLRMRNSSSVSIDSFDLCKSDNIFYLLVDLGTVKITDSLFSFDFDITFNNKIFNFVPPLLTGSTLAQAIPSGSVYYDRYEANNNSTDDTVRVGGAVITMTPMYGAKPLIVLKFQLLKDSAIDDSLIIENLDLGNEFRGTLAGVENLKFISKIFDLPERYASSVLDKDSVVFDGDSVATLISNISFNANINLQNLVVEFDTLKYAHVDSIQINQNAFSLDSTSDKKYYLTYKNVNNAFNGELFRAYFKRTCDSASEDIFKYHLTDASLSSCLKGFNLDSAKLVYIEKKDTTDTTGVEDKDSKVSLTLSKGLIQIENADLGSAVVIYDVYGRKILDEKIIDGSLEIDVKKSNAQVFIAYVIQNDRIIKKKIFNLFFDQL